MTLDLAVAPKRAGNRPSVPCSTCGRLLWWHASYVPGVSRCRACHRAAPAERAPRQQPKPLERQCAVCGSDYRSPHREIATCSRACGGILAARTRGVSGQRTGRTCEVCSITYRATYSGQRTCSRSCGAVLRFGHQPTPKALPVQIGLRLTTCPLCSSEHLTGSTSDRCARCIVNPYQPAPPSTLTCTECEQPFTSAYSGRPGMRRTTFCSDECMTRAHRRHRKRRHGVFVVSPARRRRLYRRDRWQCHICHVSVRPGAPLTDPWAATLDHLVPRSLGGSDDDDNLATAHHWCNSMRGNGPIDAPGLGAPPPYTY